MSIEIPGWVLRQAMNAEFCGRSMRDAMSFGTDHDYEVLEAALRAALEGWVVPESVQLQDPDGCWWSFNTPSALADAKSLGWPARTLYTLRKDKTP